MRTYLNLLFASIIFIALAFLSSMGSYAEHRFGINGSNISFGTLDPARVSPTTFTLEGPHLRMEVNALHLATAALLTSTGNARASIDALNATTATILTSTAQAWASIYALNADTATILTSTSVAELRLNSLSVTTTAITVSTTNLYLTARSVAVSTQSNLEGNTTAYLNLGTSTQTKAGGLNVGGNITAGNSITLGGDMLINDTSIRRTLTNSVLTFYNDGSFLTYIALYGSGNGTPHLITFANNAAETMRLTAGNKVGISSAAPVGNLGVQGSIYASSIVAGNYYGNASNMTGLPTGSTVPYRGFTLLVGTGGVSGVDFASNTQVAIASAIVLAGATTCTIRVTPGEYLFNSAWGTLGIPKNITLDIQKGAKFFTNETGFSTVIACSGTITGNLTISAVGGWNGNRWLELNSGSLAEGITVLDFAGGNGNMLNNATPEKNGIVWLTGDAVFRKSKFKNVDYGNTYYYGALWVMARGSKAQVYEIYQDSGSPWTSTWVYGSSNSYVGQLRTDTPQCNACLPANYDDNNGYTGKTKNFNMVFEDINVHYDLNNNGYHAWEISASSSVFHGIKIVRDRTGTGNAFHLSGSATSQGANNHVSDFRVNGSFGNGIVLDGAGTANNFIDDAHLNGVAAGISDSGVNTIFGTYVVNNVKTAD